MTVKRSRIGRSSSFGESSDRLHNAPKFASSLAASNSRRDSAKKAPKLSPKRRQAPPSVLKLSSPTSMIEKRSVAVSDGAFFEKCHSCKIWIGQGKDVFMSGYLRAFCSAECRDQQITIDTKMEIEKASAGKAEGMAQNNAKILFGCKVEEDSASRFQII